MKKIALRRLRNKQIDSWSGKKFVGKKAGQSENSLIA